VTHQFLDRAYQRIGLRTPAGSVLTLVGLAEAVASLDPTTAELAEQVKGLAREDSGARSELESSASPGIVSGSLSRAFFAPERLQQSGMIVHPTPGTCAVSVVLSVE
jgi:hypothetical protein